MSTKLPAVTEAEDGGEKGAGPEGTNAVENEGLGPTSDPLNGMLPASLNSYVVMAKQEYERIKAKVVHYGPPYNAECVGRKRAADGTSPRHRLRAFGF